MGDDLAGLFYAAMALGIPFLLGIAAGVGIVNARPKSTYQRLGEMIGRDVIAIHDRRKFVGEGIILSTAYDLNMPEGRRIQILVREEA